MSGKLGTLWSLMRGQRLRYALAIAATLISVFFMYYIPLISGATIDMIYGSTPAKVTFVHRILERLGGREALATVLVLVAAAMVAARALSGAFLYLRGRFSAKAAETIARDLRDRLYNHVQHLPCRYHDKAETGDMVQRCTSDLETIRIFLAAQVVELGRAAVLLALGLPFLLHLNVKMGLLSMVVIPPIIGFGAIFFRKVQHVFKESDEAEGRMTSRLQENLAGIRVVRAFARQQYEIDRFGQANAEYRRRWYTLMRMMSIYWPISDMLCFTQSGLVLIYGAYNVSRHTMAPGDLFAFIMYVQMFIWPVRNMGRILADMGKAFVSIGRVGEILSQEVEPEIVGETWLQTNAATAPITKFNGDPRPTLSQGRGVIADVPRPPSAVSVDFDCPTVAELDGHGDGPVGIRGRAEPAIGNARGEIIVENLVFNHGPEIPVLRGISMNITPGTTLAILGPSGSGKSTLINLLLRLYEYETGSIRLDGMELRVLPRKFARSQVGSVLQEPFLYSKSLRENIKLSRTDAADEEMVAAASAACIHESIENFTDGYDTLVGERGVTLSGGQRQRVALARALLKDPPILILDDAFSAVDTQTERIILRGLRNRHGRRTTIVIAHRLSTLMHADKIIVLDEGKIIQEGTHAGLIEQEGMYRRLWEIQTNLADDLAAEIQAESPITK